MSKGDSGGLVHLKNKIPLSILFVCHGFPSFFATSWGRQAAPELKFLPLVNMVSMKSSLAVNTLPVSFNGEISGTVSTILDSF